MGVYTVEGKNGKVGFYHTGKRFWQCRKCGNVGGKLGFTIVATTERFAFCPYCDECTQQESVKE